jgi:hypothetical protein
LASLCFNFKAVVVIIKDTVSTAFISIVIDFAVIYYISITVAFITAIVFKNLILLVLGSFHEEINYNVYQKEYKTLSNN